MAIFIAGATCRLGVALKHNVSVDSSKNDYRCRDKRLRYYEFPELLNMKS
jgi:hypothetical protein